MQIPSTICTLCKNDLLMITDPETGEIICNKCGMVISDKTQKSNRPEWCGMLDTLQINDRHSRTGNLTSISLGVACDIVKSRSPKPIHIEEWDPDKDDLIELKSRSKIISNLEEVPKIKVYTNTNISQIVKDKNIDKAIKEIISNW